MISQNSSFGNNMNNGNGQQPQEKRSVKLGRIYGRSVNDSTKAAFLEVGCYKSQYSMFATLAIKVEMGKDSKGRAQFETGLDKDNPSVLLNPENVASVITLCDMLIGNPEKVSQLNYMLDSGRSKLEMRGTESSVTITVTNDVGSKSIVFNATPCGFANIHAIIPVLKKFLDIIQKKQLSAKLDPEEFNGNDDGDAPF